MYELSKCCQSICNADIVSDEIKALHESIEDLQSKLEAAQSEKDTIIKRNQLKVAGMRHFIDNAEKDLEYWRRKHINGIA